MVHFGERRFNRFRTAGAYIGTDLDALTLHGNGKEDEDAYYSVSEEGPAKIYYTAVDNVGNLAPLEVVSVVVDTTAPTVFIENSDRLINKDDAYMIFPSDDVVDEEGRIIVSTKESVAFGATDELSVLTLCMSKLMMPIMSNILSRFSFLPTLFTISM